jgi:hypothetical protein
MALKRTFTPDIDTQLLLINLNQVNIPVNGRHHRMIITGGGGHC